MSEIIPATGKVKEGGGPSSIKCPMLNSTNYTVWAMRINITLKLHKVWETKKMSQGMLFQSIAETLIFQVGELDTAKTIMGSHQAQTRRGRVSKAS